MPYYNNNAPLPILESCEYWWQQSSQFTTVGDRMLHVWISHPRSGLARLTCYDTQLPGQFSILGTKLCTCAKIWAILKLHLVVVAVSSSSYSMCLRMVGGIQLSVKHCIQLDLNSIAVAHLSTFLKEFGLLRGAYATLWRADFTFNWRARSTSPVCSTLNQDFRYIYGWVFYWCKRSVHANLANG
jgi:hypothetical protein